MQSSWFFCCANWAVRRESNTYAERGESGGVFLIALRAVGEGERQEGEVVVHHRDLRRRVHRLLHQELERFLQSMASQPHEN